jgi:hypothetical protein
MKRRTFLAALFGSATAAPVVVAVAKKPNTPQPHVQPQTFEMLRCGLRRYNQLAFDIIYSAMRLAGVLAPGQALSGDDLHCALQQLNLVLMRYGGQHVSHQSDLVRLPMYLLEAAHYRLAANLQQCYGICYRCEWLRSGILEAETMYSRHWIDQAVGDSQAYLNTLV